MSLGALICVETVTHVSSLADTWVLGLKRRLARGGIILARLERGYNQREEGPSTHLVMWSPIEGDG